MTIDCSRAMISPPIDWSVGGRPKSAAVLVEGVERVRRERQGDAQEADEELGAEHVAERPHPGGAASRADRRDQVPPVEPADAEEDDVLEHMHRRVPSAASYAAGTCQAHIATM